ncbi:MAG: dCTP deaminase [Candidatus Lokiarchaeota archaeon]|nr:dCTP deaminase [Candidatus Harpocratesius repetitus]
MILNKEEIINLLREKRLTITPLIFEKQIQDSSVDLRLGTEFYFYTQHQISNFDPIGKIHHEMPAVNVKKKIGESITLHPNQFILGTTLEFIKLPSNIMAYIIGRSSWGRLGLIIATATIINPEFSGVITLELKNVGNIPIKIYPGLRIAQIVMHKITNLDRNIAQKSIFHKYRHSIGPGLSKLKEDSEIQLIKKIKKELNF